MNRQRLLIAGGLVWVCIGLILSACGTSPAVPTQTVAPTIPPKPTDTQVPAPTLIPTATLKPGQEFATVVEILDGVTIIVEIDGDQQTVCYDLTNMYDFHPYDQLADEAEAVNREMVEGQTVVLDKRDQGRTEDRDCLFRFVFLQDGTFVNAEMLRLGLAHFTGLPTWKYVDVLEAAEQEAIASELGTWSFPTSTPLVVPTAEFERFWGDLRITEISSQGVSDEYIEIRNETAMSVISLGGWSIGAEDAGQRYFLPEGVYIVQGATCRIYTAQAKSTCGNRELSFGRSSGLWNDEGDCAYLYSPTDKLEAKYCY